MIPEADTIVPGLGESAIWKVLGLTPPPGHADEAGLPPAALRHRLVDQFERFQPSIETSRGCGMGCAFCEERGIPLSRLREPEQLAESLAEAVAEYGGGEIRPYLQSSFFLPNPRWSARLAQSVERRNLSVRWRCETRVDGMKPETVSTLASAGLKVIDLGLETASLQQVRAMHKARDPIRYLGAASGCWRACAESDVWVKVNILLYPGETSDTLAETQSWLDQHAGAIKGVSVGPVVAFGPPSQAEPFLRSLAALGGRPVDPSSAASNGITQLHLSPEIGAESAERLSLELSRRYMDAEAYFALKSFSYYPRDYTRAEFNQDAAVAAAHTLPFRTAKSAALTG